ncbi:ADP-ribosylation factor-like protein 6-interacting protein 1 [Argiope bruennichi]|uniref:ADP-ribosylation factor-like protein 6-interacting protein 1 n=1 Tax=Argiope bruennichi TaxID=94029 RepID=UPI002494CE11|nr:ADP-ribosylation factor-like protein 6-interacting protein 1 [Argiope bruennichi]
MADESESKTEGVSQKSEQELVKICRRRLENWREILIHCSALLTWHKPYYPGIIAGIVSAIFLMLWYFDPSVLTTISIFGIIACILDYVVPMLSASVFDSSKWTGTQEKKYEDICHGFVDTYMKIKHMWESVRQIKETKPYLYFIGVLGALLFTAWIGNLINNLFLTYLIVLFLALLPGIKSHNVIRENISVVMGVIKGVTGQSKKKK